MSTKTEWMELFEQASGEEEALINAMKVLKIARKYDLAEDAFKLATSEATRWFRIHAN